jgi:hypothetical protein
VSCQVEADWDDRTMQELVLARRITELLAEVASARDQLDQCTAHGERLVIAKASAERRACHYARCNDQQARLIGDLRAHINQIKSALEDREAPAVSGAHSYFDALWTA